MVRRSISRRELLVTILGATLAAAACWFLASEYAGWPNYRTKATLLIDSTPDAEQVGVSSEGITIAQETLAALIVRQPLSGQVTDQVDLSITAEELVDHVRIERPEGAPIVEVVATHPDPEAAAQIANVTAAEAAKLDSPLVGASVLSTAPVPQAPVLNSVLLIVLAGVVGGLAAGGAAVYARRLPGRINHVNDLTRQTRLEVIGELELSEENEVTAGDAWVMTKLMTALNPENRNLLFTAPQAIASQAPFLELHRKFLDVFLVDTGIELESLKIIDPSSERNQTDEPADPDDANDDPEDEVEEDADTEQPSTAENSNSNGHSNGHTAFNGEADDEPAVRLSELAGDALVTVVGATDDAVSFNEWVKTHYLGPPRPSPQPGAATRAKEAATTEDPEDEEATEIVADTATAPVERLSNQLMLRLPRRGGGILRVVDGPPVLESPEVVLQATSFASVVLLVEKGTTQAEEAEMARQVLTGSGADVLGTILLG